jgi:thiol-disulfide isomerase/thioredoxin
MSKHKPSPMQLAASRSARAKTSTRRTPPRARRAAKGAQARSPWIRRGLIAAAIVAAIAVVVAVTVANSTSPAAVTGAAAPNGTFTTLSGTTEPVSALRGKPTLVWFVTTWCSSCQAGTAAMAQQIPRFTADHVRVVELENANDLGESGPPMKQFAQQLAGRFYHDPDWTFGTASSSLTREYNPSGYLDIYYLLNAAGHVVYVNSSPSATMGPLLREAAKVGSHA